MVAKIQSRKVAHYSMVPNINVLHSREEAHYMRSILTGKGGAVGKVCV